MLEATALLQHTGEEGKRERLEGKSIQMLSETIPIMAQHPSALATSAHYPRHPETQSKFY